MICNARHSEAERPGGLEIDAQLEFGRLLDPQVRRLSAVENPPDINACLAKVRGKAGSIAEQATGLNEFERPIDRRYGMAC
jgi:hypothetical protein